MNASGPAIEGMVPAELRVMTGGGFVVFIMDPDTADLFSTEHELGGHMGLYDETTRPQWRGEAARISDAAHVARTEAPAPVGIENAIALLPVRRRRAVELVPPC